ncbi:hypothetical protein [Corynebacterium pilosum]|uniref:hypothetical protein n=1 Tax=Corynebacterium pilosum TaxID=35756 RepID=UPI00035DB140|nr:hypothetical protein [Corynebacterium pilosum]
MAVDNEPERVIMDAGPGLNFLAAGHERILTAVVGRLHVPETVIAEISRKSAKDSRRFRRADSTLRKMIPGWVTVLEDNIEDEGFRKILEMISSAQLQENWQRE